MHIKVILTVQWLCLLLLWWVFVINKTMYDSTSSFSIITARLLECGPVFLGFPFFLFFLLHRPLSSNSESLTNWSNHCFINGYIVHKLNVTPLGKVKYFITWRKTLISFLGTECSCSCLCCSPTVKKNSAKQEVLARSVNIFMRRKDNVILCLTYKSCLPLLPFRFFHRFFLLQFGVIFKK